MTVENLWGEMQLGSEVKPPVTILREQAALLNDMTNKILTANVTVKRDGTKLSSTLRIIAPALDNYQYIILHASYGLHLYPVIVSDRTKLVEAKYPSYECNNESEYKEILRSILGSDEVRKVISSLIIQSKNPS